MDPLVSARVLKEILRTPDGLCAQYRAVLTSYFLAEFGPQELASHYEPLMRAATPQNAASLQSEFEGALDSYIQKYRER